MLLMMVPKQRDARGLMTRMSVLRDCVAFLLGCALAAKHVAR
jgi:hypothetical protein